MQHLSTCFASLAVALLSVNPTAVAQFHQQRAPAVYEPAGEIQHLSLTSPQRTASPSHEGMGTAHHGAAPGTRRMETGSQASVQLAHHHGSGSQGTFYWGLGYPMIWTSGYTPAFPIYGDFYYQTNPLGYAPLPLLPEPRRIDVRQAEPPKGPIRPDLKATSAEQKARAGKVIVQGDSSFAKQKYLSAVERYKAAVAVAPDVAEFHFRQGHALVAIGQFEGAAKAFRRGLKIRSDWSGSPFRLDQLYGADRIAKTAHFESLAKAVEENPFNSELLVAMGVELYFDGQRDKSGVFFSRAAQLGGNLDHTLDDFLPSAGLNRAGREAAGGKIAF